MEINYSERRLLLTQDKAAFIDRSSKQFNIGLFKVLKRISIKSILAEKSISLAHPQKNYHAKKHIEKFDLLIEI